MSLEKGLILRTINKLSNDPDRLDKYLYLLAESGMLKGVKVLELRKVSSRTLKELHRNKITVIIK